MPTPSLAVEVDEERVFRALSDSHRRELLELLLQKNGQTLSELDSHLPMTRFGTMKHLRMLESAGLVETRRDGRKKLHFLNVDPIRSIHERWICRFTGATPGEALPGTAQGNGRQVGLRPTPPAGATSMPVQCELFIHASADKVWQAITSPRITPGFFYGTRVDGDWRPGATIRYLGSDGRVVAEGSVVELEPPARLVHTFSARWDERVSRDAPHHVTWTIQPAGAVCRVVMEHSGFAGDTPTYRSMRAGSSVIVSGLKTLLETGEPLPLAAAEGGW